MLSIIQHTIHKLVDKAPREVLENSWSLLVALLLAALLLLLSACESKQVTLQPEVKPLLEAVYASGFVRAQNEYEVFAEGEGYVVEKLVQDGDTIKRGDALFVLNATQPGARFQIAKQNYALSTKNIAENSSVLEELKAMMQSAEAKMKFDSVNYQRYKNLINQQVGTRVEFDRMKLSYENSSHEYQVYKNRYQKTLNELQVARENARQQLIIAGDDSGKNVIRSLADGRVFFTRKERGELVRRGESLAIIGNTDTFYVELTVDELDIQKLKLGQLVLVKADAFPANIFKARVSKIYPLIDTRQQSLRIDAVLTEPLPGAFSGLALEANIVIRQKEKTLTVPKAALLSGDSLWILIKGERAKISVTKGIETMDEVEILQGIDSATTVLLNQ